jgi:serine/threonine protein kinase
LIWQTVDGVAFRMNQAQDFSFLARFGRVFRVLDDQDSGNLCFGLEGEAGRLFLKFAGARTARASVSPGEAVENLRAAARVTRDLAHPRLLPLLWDGEIGGGYAAVFPWTDAICMGRMYPAQRAAFFDLPLAARLSVEDDLLDFLVCTHERGYVAVDFYDGSVLFDRAAGHALFCDVDLFARKPFINRRGRLWGSSRFMAPEEFALGAQIDERTNVYLAGCMAFALVGDERDRTRETWRAGDRLFRIASRAASPERENRYSTLSALRADWLRARAEEGV